MTNVVWLCGQHHKLLYIFVPSLEGMSSCYLTEGLSVEGPEVYLFNIIPRCGSRKYPYPPQGLSSEILRGGGSQKPKFLRESTKQNW